MSFIFLMLRVFILKNDILSFFLYNYYGGYMKKVIVLILSILVITGFTFLSGFLSISNLELKRLFFILINLLNGFVAFIAMKLTGIKIDFDFKNSKQFLIGFCIALILSLSIAFIPALCGVSLVGGHVDFSWNRFLFNLFFYMIIIGPVEELIFRVYIQETCIGFFKNKWVGVVLASLLFGFYHFINGSFLQVLFTFGIGLIFGFCKFLIKDCKYLGISFGHGLYDFLNVIVTMFIV